MGDFEDFIKPVFKITFRLPKEMPCHPNNETKSLQYK